MSNSSLSAYTSYLNKVSAHLNGYSSLAMISIGVPGNLLSLIIFSRLIQKKNQHGSTLHNPMHCRFDLNFIYQFGRSYASIQFWHLNLNFERLIMQAKHFHASCDSSLFSLDGRDHYFRSLLIRPLRTSIQIHS